MTSMITRFLPSAVTGVWAILLSMGVPASTIRIPGMLALCVSLALMAGSEVVLARSERRRGHGRRRSDDDAGS